MTPVHTVFEIAPLTKKGENGEVYFRRSEVLEQLEKLLAVDPAELERRVQILKESDQDSIKSENLVFLLRKYHGLWLEGYIYDTLAFRVRGIVGKFYRKVKAGNNEAADDYLQGVLFQLLDKILRFDSDAGQYAQVSFGEYVSGIGQNEFKKYLTQVRRSNETDSIDEDSEDDNEFIRIERQLTAPESDPLERMKRDRILSLLPEEIREVCILRMEGWQISSNDPNEPTISKKMEKTDRTIRNWLTKAAKILRENGYHGS